jgi:hypothetical protein
MSLQQVQSVIDQAATNTTFLNNLIQSPDQTLSSYTLTQAEIDGIKTMLPSWTTTTTTTTTLAPDAKANVFGTRGG